MVLNGFWKIAGVRGLIRGEGLDLAPRSRVVSVEKSTENITIVGNIFRNGVRGSWINQPKNIIIANIIIANNIFENNVFRGAKKNVYVGKHCDMPRMEGNVGLGEIVREIGDAQSGDGLPEDTWLENR